jgi:transposase
MQGHKEYQEKLFLNFRLSERVPENNFYRQLKSRLDLSYLREMTAKYYGREGQKSIDPCVFFKLMLIGYMENINSDRQIIEISKLRLDMLYFLGYDLDEPLPSHSTLSRTRQLFGEEVFLEFFRNILRMCVQKGMVSGKIQAIDSAFIKANASMDSLVERELTEKVKKYYSELTDNDEDQSERKKTKTRHRNVKHGDLFVSTSDPDSRVSRKQGKLPALNHLGIVSVDTENHVICGAVADFADKNDSDTTEKIVGQVLENMRDNDLSVEEVLADTGYSSGLSYDYLEKQNIKAYIPPIGGYKPEKDGFKYDEEEDCYICSQGKKLPFKGIQKAIDKKTSSKEYRSKAADCRDCPLKLKCCKKGRYRQLRHSTAKPHYDKAYRLLNTWQGKRKMRQRGATVEPVWGTLLHFRRLKKLYTIGNELANKQVLMAASAYNLKKHLAFGTLKKAAKKAITGLVADLKMKISFFPTHWRDIFNVTLILF